MFKCEGLSLIVLLTINFVSCKDSEIRSPWIHLQDWHRVRSEPSRVYVLRDVEAYTQCYNQTFASDQTPKPSPPWVDFSKHNVIAISWGWKPSTHYALEIKSVEIDTNLITIRIISCTPKVEYVGARISYPSVVVVVPKNSDYHLIVEGDRFKHNDFREVREKGYRITVIPKNPDILYNCQNSITW